MSNLQTYLNSLWCSDDICQHIRPSKDLLPNNVNLSLVKFCDIHLRTISKPVPKLESRAMRLNVTL